MVKTRSKSNREPAKESPRKELAEVKKPEPKRRRSSSHSKARNAGSEAMAEDYSSKSLHVDILRHRFAHYQPQKIDAMSLTQDKALLAVGRENRAIEIWKADTFA